MNSDRYILILTLQLIKRGVPFNDSYRIIRILEWKFKIIETNLVFGKIREQEHVEYDLIKGIHYYRLTEKGSKVLQEQSGAALTSLSYEYPNEADFLFHLFDKS